MVMLTIVYYRSWAVYFQEGGRLATAVILGVWRIEGFVKKDWMCACVLD